MSDLACYPSEVDTAMYFVPVGSRLYGTETVDSDYDFKGILQPSRSTLLGLGGPDGSDRAQEGTTATGRKVKVEVTMYSMRKWVELCLKGNPTLIETAFAWQHAVVFEDAFLSPLFGLVRSNARNTNTVKAYLGYITSQHCSWSERIDEWASFGRCPESRKAAYERNGYDPKMIAHVLRLCFQLTELLESGAINPRLSGAQRELVTYTRAGVPDRPEVEEVAQEAVRKVNELATERLPTLPLEIDRALANTLLISFHERCFAHFTDGAPPRVLSFAPHAPKPGGLLSREDVARHILAGGPTAPAKHDPSCPYHATIVREGDRCTCGLSGAVP